mmetsp:Transcript_72460/g.155167  ORF Transcript_72460/g.155167 Transcript_72460/m.155167 type:complete len:585 (-) Transcript_72460:64-1818(-)
MTMPFATVFLACVCGQAALGLQPGEREIVAHLRQRNLGELERLFWDVANPESPRYLQHLTAEGVAALIGATDGDIEEAQSWLRALGAEASSIRVSALRDTVTASFAASAKASAGSPLLSAERRPASVEFLVHREPLIAGGAAVDHPPLQSSGLAAMWPGPRYTVGNMKKAYGIPVDLEASNDTTLQMVWGPGTFGFSEAQLGLHKARECPKLNMAKVHFDTENHGSPGGDNFGEGNLDTKMIASFGLNVETIVSNTNTSASTEEGNGFGQAMLDFVTELATRPRLPHVLSLSLGSLSAASCDLLCDQAVKAGHSRGECEAFLQQQRQVCMFLSPAQSARINTAFQVLGLRGVTVFGSSGDGGSHFSFSKFTGSSAIVKTLNEIACKNQLPVSPTDSPYIVSVGGTMWADGAGKRPVTWKGFGGGSGSGFSLQFSRPSHQMKSVEAYLNGTAGLPPASSFNRNGRAYPDFSAVGVDGTSQSCPVAAGIFSLLIDQRLSAGLPPLGFLAPRLWKVAEEHPGEAFQDVPEGNSRVSCSNGFPSISGGWDPNTGFGRPIWSGLVKYFASDSHLGTAAVAAARERTIVV